MALTPGSQRALRSLGANLKTARIRRRMSIKDFAVRTGVSERTVMRLEKGDDGVSIGTLTMACLVLGEICRVAQFLDPGSDDMGLLLDRDALPKRIDRKRTRRSSKTEPKGADKRPSSSDDEEGVGF